MAKAIEKGLNNGPQCLSHRNP